MRILALIGSPRKRSNTDILVDQILQGSKEKGHTGEKLYLYAYEILPCIDCRNCKKGHFVCPIKDGMKKIYPKMEEVDLIIFGTPNYWYGPTGKMKLLIDRMRPFVANGRMKGKKWIFVTPAAEGPQVCRPLVQMLRLSFDYLGMKLVGKFLVRAYEKAEIKKNRRELDRVYKFGASL
jgi:multimeric flavodoxin WrbA